MRRQPPYTSIFLACPTIADHRIAQRPSTAGKSTCDVRPWDALELPPSSLSSHSFSMHTRLPRSFFLLAHHMRLCIPASALITPRNTPRQSRNLRWSADKAPEDARRSPEQLRRSKLRSHCFSGGGMAVGVEGSRVLLLIRGLMDFVPCFFVTRRQFFMHVGLVPSSVGS